MANRKASAKLPRNYSAVVNAVSQYRELKASGKVGNIYECSCGYGWDKNKVVRHHFCPNCGRKVQEVN